jgi:2-polyprenyl-6-methoxyphenol hydroxylase-like FAD-dependent oxidoreductase
VSSLIEKKAIVIGAGMGGLAAAKALANHFGHVAVLDRDILPLQPEPRIGTAQSKHTHVLIGGGLEALSVLFPGFKEDVHRAGAVKLRVGLEACMERPGYDPFPARDLGWDIYSASRPLFELVTRRRVEQQENIELLTKGRVTELIASHDGSSIIGVLWESPDGQVHTLHADIIVDASGRGNLTLELLSAQGLPSPEKTEIRIDQAYSTAIFEKPATAPPNWKSMIVLPSAPTSSRGAFLFPIENNKCIVSVGGNHGDAPPGDLAGFFEFLKTLRTQTVYNAVKDAKPVGEIARFVLPSSVRRHFEKLQTFPPGLLVIGDGVCRFNPVFGQGMSVAAQEAVVLDGLLATKTNSPDALGELALNFFAACQDVIETPWAAAMNDFVYPKTRGQRPPDFVQRMQYGIALTRLAAEDAAVHKLATEVSHLLKPQSALREPELAKRVMERMAAALL